MNPADHFLSN